MAKISVGDIVFVRFPFSDLSQYKMRPALILADAQKGDLILCQITSKSYADRNAIELGEDSFSSGGLLKVSFVRPAKLFTANIGIVEKVVAHLKPEIKKGVVTQIIELLTEGQ